MCRPHPYCLLSYPISETLHDDSYPLIDTLFHLFLIMAHFLSSKLFEDDLFHNLFYDIAILYYYEHKESRPNQDNQNFP